MIKKSVLAVSLFVLLVSSAVCDESSQRVENMAKELVKLRAEVESLYTKIDLKKIDVEFSLKGLMTQKNDSERNKKQLESAVADLNKGLLKEESEIAFKKKQRGNYLGITLKQVEKTRKFIENSLGFKQVERLAEVDGLKKRLEEKTLSPDKALARLWSIHEDENRLTSDSGLYNMEIKIKNKNHLVKIVRLGMVFLYFKTMDGKSVGCAVKNDGGWEYKEVSSDKESKQIRYLFECFEKNVQSGFFMLPNPNKK